VLILRKFLKKKKERETIFLSKIRKRKQQKQRRRRKQKAADIQGKMGQAKSFATPRQGKKKEQQQQ